MATETHTSEWPVVLVDVPDNPVRVLYGGVFYGGVLYGGVESHCVLVCAAEPRLIGSAGRGWPW
jgi:hypothetical protein